MTNNESYYTLYYNNKQDYYKLINTQIGGYRRKQNDFYFLHSTSFENLVQILKTDKLYANIHINKRYKRLSGDSPSKYVFANVITNNHPITNHFGMGLIFSKDVLNEQSIIFNPGWRVFPDDESVHIKSVKEMKKLIKTFDLSNKYNTMTLGPNKLPLPFMMTHEILFEDSIDLIYLIGIHCPGCDNKQKRKIRILLRKNNRQNVKIYGGWLLPWHHS